MLVSCPCYAIVYNDFTYFSLPTMTTIAMAATDMVLLFGASLSQPRMHMLSGVGCYVCCIVCSHFNCGLRGVNCPPPSWVQEGTFNPGGCHLADDNPQGCNILAMNNRLHQQTAFSTLLNLKGLPQLHLHKRITNYVRIRSQVYGNSGKYTIANDRKRVSHGNIKDAHEVPIENCMKLSRQTLNKQ